MSTSSSTATHNIRTLPLLRASQGMDSSLSACSVKRSQSLYSMARQAHRSVFLPAIGLLAMTLLDLEALDEIALGATVLGTGGGGDPTLGKLMAQQAVARHGPIQLLPLDEVPDEEWIIPTAMMGAPTVLVEKIPSGTEVLDAFRMLERRLHCRAVATLSIEAGGVNSMIPMVVAASLGLPIVDADGMGRAFPEIQMVTPTMSAGADLRVRPEAQPKVTPTSFLNAITSTSASATCCPTTATPLRRRRTSCSGDLSMNCGRAASSPVNRCAAISRPS